MGLSLSAKRGQSIQDNITDHLSFCGYHLSWHWMRILLQFAKKKSHASVQEGGQVEESSPKTAFVWQALGGGQHWAGRHAGGKREWFMALSWRSGDLYWGWLLARRTSAMNKKVGILLFHCFLQAGPRWYSLRFNCNWDQLLTPEALASLDILLFMRQSAEFLGTHRKFVSPP